MPPGGGAGAGEGEAAPTRGSSSAGGDEEVEAEAEEAPVDRTTTANTQDFLRSMRKAHRNSLVKLEELQQAASRSAARQAVKVNMASVATSVGAAQAGSLLARRIVQPVRNGAFWEKDGSSAGGEAMSSVVPMYLGHLMLPLPSQKRDELGLHETEFTLPGSVDAGEPAALPTLQQQAPAPAPAAAAAQPERLEVPSLRGRSGGGAGVGSLDLPPSRGRSAGSAGLGGLAGLVEGGSAASSRPATEGGARKPREMYLAEKVICNALTSATREQDLETPCVEESSEVPDMTGSQADMRRDPSSLEALMSASDNAEPSQPSQQKSDWPPRGPRVRFKGVMQFSETFTRTGKSPSNSSSEASRKTKTQSLLQPVQKPKEEVELTHPIVAWLNEAFALAIRTDLHLTSGFPLILLIVLDAIYPGRVKWCQVDWDLKYQNAVYKNYAILMVLWKELNMERAREFRREETGLDLDGMPNARLAHKLEFLLHLKRWYQQRIHSTHSTYNPMERRRAYMQTRRKWGHEVEVPCWVKYEEGHEARLSTFSKFARAYESMPEYRRLIWFLGSPSHQTM